MKENDLKKSSIIRDTLLRLGIIKNENVEIFSKNTRDKNNLTVYKDSRSKVIFIDEYYIGDEEYTSGDYRTQSLPLTSYANADLEDLLDTERRYKKYKQFIVNKKICDFGCGKGNFLRISKSHTKSLVGIEIQKNFNNTINNEGIKCISNLDELSEPMDTFFLFHCLEHLPDPSKILKEIHNKLKLNGEGQIVIEVPHAKDFLLDQLEFEPFKNFTLWSQHLILHTRESLNSLLLDAGFKNISIEGVQRYGLANHLTWLKYGKPGGHKNPLSIIETENLQNSYANALSKLDANDTLVAIATT
jgi:2-polyprenyl-3-methyl-5-hydroxy-6-metoxy-1,4-benzoquinol methylase